MNWLLFIAGFLVTTWAIIEGLWTTLWIDGNSAPITSKITSWIWKGWKAVFKQKRHKALSLAGPLVLAFTIISWILWIWLGWSLMLAADYDAVATSKGEIPGFVGRMWYVAYTMFTVGNGDYLPQQDLWRLLSSFMAFSGMGMVTLSITYIFQILSAVVTKRSFSSSITAIATEADEFVVAQWTGDSFGAIELQLNSYSGQLDVLNEQHLAYPILHYYHAKKAEKSSANALPVLDDALIIISECMEKKYQPAATILTACRSSITSYLETLKAAHIHPSDLVPPLPDWHKLKEKGLPVCSKQEYEEVFDKHADRRKLMKGLNINAAWEWPSKLENG